MIHISQQSAHHGRQGDLGRFSLGPKALVERAQYWVTSGRAQRRHVQGQADFGATATNAAFALHHAAFSGPGCQAGQGGYFLAVQSSQFGQMSQDHPGGMRSDTLDFIQAVDAPLERGILFQQGFNLFFHRRDLGLEMGHEFGMLPTNKGILMMLGLGFGQSPPVDQLFPNIVYRISYIVYRISYIEKLLMAGAGGDEDRHSASFNGGHVCME